MRWNIYIKFNHPDNTALYWKLLCCCFDHESLGIVERLLSAQGFESKTEKVP